MADEIKEPAEIFAQTANLPAGVYDEAHMVVCINAALRRYDKDEPNYVYGSFAGDGTSLYDLSAQSLPSWDEQESDVMGVDYPYTPQAIFPLGFEDYNIIDDPTDGLTLVFVTAVPAATENIRLRYSIEWTEALVPSQHISAIAKLAAANYLRMMAARFSQRGESTIAADVFSGQSAGDSFLRVARDYEDQYSSTIGVSVDGSSDIGEKASVHVTQVDVGGQDGLGPLVGYEDA